MDLIKAFSDLKFVPGGYFMWSPTTQTVTYDRGRLRTNTGRIALLHEVGHARLQHRFYTYDMQLLTMEMEAWDFVREHAQTHNLDIDELHIASCISSYDNWLSKRATCPDCANFSLQSGRDAFRCFACGSTWNVNWRKDRRVKRTVTHRFARPDLVPAHN